jgi:hypothetical protein
MALWSGAALLTALIACQRDGTRSGWLAAIAAGAFCFLAVKCKETGLGVVPPVLLLVASRRGRVKSLGYWIIGGLAGWVLLTFLDGVFAGDPWFSWRYSTYFPDRPPNPNPTIRMGIEYVEFLSSREFLAFSLLGVAGGLLSFRENRTVRAVAVWLLGVIAFQSLSAWRFGGIQALDRYCVGIGVPLVILSGHWFVKQWQRPAQDGKGYSIGLIVALLIVVGPAVYGLFNAEAAGFDPKNKATRAYFFMVPLSVVLLFAVPWLTSRRLLVRASLVVLVVIACTLTVQSALRYVKRSEDKLRPWLQLTSELDNTGARLAIWKLPGKPLNKLRVGWRCRALSKRPPEDIQVRNVKGLDEIEDDEWLITDWKWWRNDTPEKRAMLSRGWRPLVAGAEGRQLFGVFRRK